MLRNSSQLIANVDCYTMVKKLKPKLHVRENIIDFLQRTARFLKNYDPATHDLQVQARIEKLDEKWDEFEDIQTQIEEMEEHEEKADDHKKIRADFEELYFQVRAGLNRSHCSIRNYLSTHFRLVPPSAEQVHAGYKPAQPFASKSFTKLTLDHAIKFKSVFALFLFRAVNCGEHVQKILIR